MNKSKHLSMPLQFSADAQLKSGDRVSIPLGDITPEQKLMRESKKSELEI